MEPTSLLLTPPISPSDGSMTMNWPSSYLTTVNSMQVDTINVQVLQRYLDRGGQCNICHPGTGLSLLAWATKCSSMEGVQLLLNDALKKQNRKTYNKVKELVTFPSRHGVTPIHMATQQNLVQVLSLFGDYIQLEKQQEYQRQHGNGFTGLGDPISNDSEWLNVVDNKCWTPLHYGVQYNSCQAVDFLLYHGAFGSPKDRVGVTPLTLALLLNHVDMVQRLIHTLDDHDFVTLLQHKHDDKNKMKIGPVSDQLWVVLLDHHYEEIKWDIKEDENGNAQLQRDEWIYLSVFWNRGDVLARILQYQQDRKNKHYRNRNQNDSSVLPTSPSPLSTPSASSLSLSSSTTTTGRNVTSDKEPVWKRPEDNILFYALQQGKLDMVKQLYMAGYTPPISPSGDNPCLLYAAAHGFVDIISFLYTNSTSTECVHLTLQLAGQLRSHVLHQLNAVMTLDKIMLLNPIDPSALP